jgi:hypothetical protein
MNAGRRSNNVPVDDKSFTGVYPIAMISLDTSPPGNSGFFPGHHFSKRCTSVLQHP